MKYNVGDKVRIKSLDWYNENKSKRGFICFGYANFIPEMSRYCGEILTINQVVKEHKQYRVSECKFAWTDEMIEGLVEEETKPKLKFKVGDEVKIKVTDIVGTVESIIRGQLIVNYKDSKIPARPEDVVLMESVEKETKPKDMGEVSDGYHTFNELYEYRMLYNAALFNEFAKQGLYDVHKSRKHSDGEYPFGDSNWFIVMAELPTGQISNHYEMKDWDKFQIPEKPLANKWDEHSPRDVADRLTNFTNPKKEYPKTYEECCLVLEYIPHTDDVIGYKWDVLKSLQKLLICRDAYWKLYGEEMGLGKSWEPDFDDLSANLEYLKIVKGCFTYSSRVFVFPTEEMRDAFYENFKELINSCKELL